MIKVICLFGKSGAGKGVILNELIEQYSKTLNKIISYTSRSPREGERNGIDYFFITKEQFLQKIKNNEMLEHTQFNDWYYGTDISSLSADKINIGVFNPEGIKSLMTVPNIELQTYYIQTSDKIRLLRQLKRETYPDVKEIIRRFLADEIDFSEDKIKDIEFTSLCNDNLNDIKTCAAFISGSFLMDKNF